LEKNDESSESSKNLFTIFKSIVNKINESFKKCFPYLYSNENQAKAFNTNQIEAIGCSKANEFNKKYLVNSLEDNKGLSKECDMNMNSKVEARLSLQSASFTQVKIEKANNNKITENEINNIENNSQNMPGKDNANANDEIIINNMKSLNNSEKKSLNNSKENYLYSIFRNDLKSKNKTGEIIKIANEGGNSFEEEDPKINPLSGKSLCLFSFANKLRILCWLINKSIIFEYLVIFCIIISMVVQVFDSPLLRAYSVIKTLLIVDLITTVVFLVEFLLKVISYGFLLNGKQSYLRNTLNLLDFLCLIISIITNILNIITIFFIENNSNSDLNSSSELKSATSKSQLYYILRIIKILRILRLCKIIQKSKFLQAVLKTLLKSQKQILYILVIGIGFILMFSIFGITYFGGLLSRCDFRHVPKFNKIENNLVYHSNLFLKDSIISSINRDDLNLSFLNAIQSKWNCLDFGGVWINNYPNFDSIRSSFLLFFEMLTTENWTFLMFSALDSNKPNKQPEKNISNLFALFFIIYMIFAYFLLLNLSYAILSYNFKTEKDNIQNLNFKFPIQNEFFKIYKKLCNLQLPPLKQKVKNSKLSKILTNILDSIYFDSVITCCIIANLITLMMNWPGMDKETSGFISNTNSIFNYAFIFEAVLKLYVYKLSYFYNGWNVIDFIIVCSSILTILVKTFSNSASDIFDTSILRAMRVARILRLLKKAKTLNKIFNLFIDTIKPVANFGVLYLLLLFIYAVTGMNIFSHLKYQQIISEKWNFENFTNAIFLMLRIATGESWNIIMNECMKQRGLDFFCKYSFELNEEDLRSNQLIY